MGIEDVTGRIARDLEHLKQYTATPGNGCTRLPFTKEARDAVNYLKELMTEAGLEVTEDAAGNVIGTLKGEDPDAPCVMMGSHYDSVVNGGELGERKGVNVPNVPVRLPAITEKDKEDIKFGVEQKIDFIAASFVRNAECILEIRAYLKELKAPYIPIIAKIENAEGIQNIDEIIRCADGIMVARGDLGVEIPAENVPYLQKMIIQKCNDNYRPVITATQMLDSMIRNPRPTRAEVTDVATAVYDGTDAVMLSGETASGKYPVEALQMMVHIVENTEEHLDYDLILRKAEEQRMKSTTSALCHATVTTAHNLGAKCIITPSASGATARVVSKFKPKTEIIGVTPNEEVMRRMQIYWGVRPLKSLEFKTTEDVCNGAVDLALAKQIVEPGDIVVLTAGIPSPHISSQKEGVSNIMQIAVV